MEIEAADEGHIHRPEDLMATVNHGWNWDKVDDAHWAKPSEDVFYFLDRWKDRGLNSILDLGCGIGRHSLLFAEKGFTVTAFDGSESGLARLKASAHDANLPIATAVGDLTSLPFDDEKFDAILAYHSIYHVNSEGMKKALTEVARILRPGGEIYMSIISKTDNSYTAAKCQTIDDNVRLKTEVDGTVLPHFFVHYDDIRTLLADWVILAVRQVEDLDDGKSSWHYFVHAMKGK